MPKRSPPPRILLRVLAVVSLVGLSACSDSPVALQHGEDALDRIIDRPAFSIAEPTHENTAYDEDVEVELLTTGELKVRNRLTGAVVYAPLDTAEMETIALMMHGLRVGDAEYQALSALNPYENAPPGFEPFSAPVGELSVGAGGRSAVTSGGVNDPGNASTSPLVLVRRSADGEPIALDSPLTHVSGISLRDRTYAEWTTSRFRPTALSLEGWDPMECVYAAHTIALHRANYLNQRREPLGALRQMTELTGANVVVLAGKVTVKTAAAQALIAGLMTKVVGVAVSSKRLTIARNVYNAHNCQQTIVVGQSLSNPTSVFPGGGMPWNGRTCTYQTQTWEVSYDGGANWQPFNVVVEICTYPATQ